jgi:histidinol-phosphate aminotransferase
MTVTPSEGNFVLAEVPAAQDARALYDRLLKRGVVVRPVGIYGLPRHLRITIGTVPENERLLRTLVEVLA